MGFKYFRFDSLTYPSVPGSSLIFWTPYLCLSLQFLLLLLLYLLILSNIFPALIFFPRVKMVYFRISFLLYVFSIYFLTYKLYLLRCFFSTLKIGYIPFLLSSGFFYSTFLIFRTFLSRFPFPFGHVSSNFPPPYFLSVSLLLSFLSL